MVAILQELQDPAQSVARSIFAIYGNLGCLRIGSEFCDFKQNIQGRNAFNTLKPLYVPVLFL